MNKLTGIRAGVLFSCYTVLTSPKKDETAVYGCKSWLVLGSYSYRFTDKFLFCVVHQSCNQYFLYFYIWLIGLPRSYASGILYTVFATVSIFLYILDRRSSQIRNTVYFYMVWPCAFSTGLFFVNPWLNVSVSGCTFEFGIELQVLSASKITGIRAGVSFCCYTVLKSPKKDETAVYGCKSWLALGSP